MRVRFNYRVLLSLLLLIGLHSAQAFQSNYSQVNVAGSFNEWDSETPNMQLVADNLWQADLTIPSASFEFKFTTAGFAQNWGLTNQPHTTLPMAAEAITQTGPEGNLSVSNPSGNTQIRFLLNDASSKYAVFLLNNPNENLLYNPSFETAGSTVSRAQYWQMNNPIRVYHGDSWGSASRDGPDAAQARTGDWVGSIPGSSLGGQPNSGFWQEVPVEPGFTYEASAWFKVTHPNWTAQKQEIKIEFYGFDHGPALDIIVTPLQALDETWVKHAVTAVAPPGAAWARLVINVEGVGASGAMFIDDASLFAIGERRTETFNGWGNAVENDCYNFASWILCTGKAVSAYTWFGDVVPLARSGLAASLYDEGSYVQTPQFQSGVGTISFYYRHGYQGDPDEGPVSEDRLHLSVQVSPTGEFWTEVAAISNIFNTSFVRADVFQNLNQPYHARIVHKGGSSNRVALIIDDVSIAFPSASPRIMNFDDWDASATNAGCHMFLNWNVCTGIVSSALAVSGKGAQIFGSDEDSNYLSSPTFVNGYGTINFAYRRGFNGINTVGLSLESSTNGTDWTVLDTVSNIGVMETGQWETYSGFFFQNTPHQIRIRNIRETNVIGNVFAYINEGFEGAPSPPTGWVFSPDIGIYEGSHNVGNTGDPSLRFDATDARVTTPFLLNPTNVYFMIKGQTISAENSFVVEGLIEGSWQTLQTYTAIGNSKRWENIALPPNVSQIRFTYNKPAGGNLSFDDVIITGTGADGGPQPPQRLLIDNVNIGPPIEYRNQNFDSWPTKNTYTAGETRHQGWRLNGSVVVNTNKAYEGQAARLLKQEVEGVLVRIRQTDGTSGKRWNVDNILITDYPGGGEYFVDFEADTSTLLSGSAFYALGTYNLNGLNWEIGPQALIGDLDGDMKIDSRAARIKREGTEYGAITMIEGKPNGIGTISFYYARSDFRDDRIGNSPSFVVEYSVEGGANWTQIGDETSLVGVDELTLFEETVNDDGAGGLGVDPDTFIISHFLPDGIGSFSFRYRNWLDNPSGNQIGTLIAQTSADGVTWSNQMTVTVNNGEYHLAEMYLNEPDHFYFRILLDDGVEAVLVDDIKISRPQDRATVTLFGWNDPEIPFINDEVTLNAQVSPQFGAHTISVTSYYRIGSSGPFTALPMESTSGNLFQSISNIPPQPTNTIVQYYMEAWYDGPGSDQTRPVVWPADAPDEPAWYGIPRNPPGRVWINEVDYRSVESIPEPPPFGSQISHEFVELAGFADTDMTGWTIEFRSGYTAEYLLFDRYVLTNVTVLPDSFDGFGFFVLAGEGIDKPPRNILLTNRLGLTSRRPGAVRLLNEMGGEEDAVSYGGNVPNHTYITTLDPDTSLSNSISLIGVGSESAHFSWGSETTMPTPGAPNEGQTFADPAFIAFAPGSLTFPYIADSFSPPPQMLIVSNAGLSDLTYEIGTSHDWLTVIPEDEGGEALEPGEAREHSVQVNTSGMTGNRNGTVTIFSGVAPNSPQTVSVSVLETVLDTALLHYPLDRDTAETALNQGTLGGAGNLTLSGGARFSMQGQGVSGKLGDYAYISPTNTALAQTEAALTGLNNLESFTISGWLRPTQTGSVNYVLGNRASGQGFEIKTTEDYQNLSFVSSAGGTPSAVTSTNGVFPTNTWSFFAIIYDSTDEGPEAVRFYRGTTNNSVFIYASLPKDALGSSGESTNPFHLGGTGANAFKGWIDDVHIYDSALDLMTLEAIRVAGTTRDSGEGSVPEITAHPQDDTIMLGQEASFSVSATGLPLPNYQWRRNGEYLDGATDSGLLIPNAQLSHTGVYDVVVYNVNGSVTSQVAHLIVNDIPRFIADLEDQHFYQGDAVRFGVELTGHPWPSIEWTYNGSPLGMFANQTNVTFGAISSSAAGLWRVTASNEYGVAQSRVATVRVLDPNAFPFTTDDALGPEPGGAGIVLRWQSAYGRVFDVYWGTNLMNGYESFIPIATDLPATPPMNVYTDSVHGAESPGFYFIDIREP